VSGGTRILPEDYLIPQIIFAPEKFSPQLIQKLGSQIDLAPTLLGLLGFSYQSRFFGMDLLKEDPKRAFLSTYQKIGYMDDVTLTILSPIKQVEKIKWTLSTRGDSESVRIDKVNDESDDALKTAVAYYKVASDWFRDSLLVAERKFSKNSNRR
jgi:phosphoglycerol transferase MdoB-like AlkP superfamily enzyme